MTRQIKRFKVTPKNHPEYSRVEMMVEKWMDLFEIDHHKVKDRKSVV